MKKWVCGECGTTYVAWISKCYACGHSPLAEEEASPTQMAAQGYEGPSSTCGTCGAWAPLDLQICPLCGAQISEDGEQQCPGTSSSASPDSTETPGESGQTESPRPAPTTGSHSSPGQTAPSSASRTGGRTHETGRGQRRRR